VTCAIKQEKSIPKVFIYHEYQDNSMIPIVNYLAGKIGPRVAGTREEKEAAEFLANKMREIGLETEIQRFKFIGWRPTRGPFLKVLEPIETNLNPSFALFSGNTPKGGVTGKLKYVGTMYLIENMFEWPKYAVVDDEGHHLAYVAAFFDGPTVPLPLTRMGRMWGRAPYIIIGKDDYDIVKKWIDEGKTVKVNVNIAGEFLIDLTSQNVIGKLKGETLPEEEIIVCAHYDSAYSSPGADDNASGVEAMLRVAENLVKKKLKKTVKFIAFGAEEYGQFGSNYYVESLKEQGQLEKVKAVINLDMVGAGKTLVLASEPQKFGSFVRKVIETSELKSVVKVEDGKIAEDSDHWGFYVNGIPVTMLLFWPYDYYHQSKDTVEKIQEDIIVKTSKVAQTLVEALAYPV